MKEEEADAAAAEGRAAQIRTMDRSERIRTYNFPESRVSDHRIGYKANNLDAVLDGDLEALFGALHDADRTARLEADD
jgi:peptide chain release factor 1